MILWKLGVQRTVCSRKGWHKNGDLSSTFPWKYLSLRIKQDVGWGEGYSTTPNIHTWAFFTKLDTFTVNSQHQACWLRKKMSSIKHANHYSLILLGVTGFALIKEGEYIDAWDFLVGSHTKTGKNFYYSGNWVKQVQWRLSWTNQIKKSQKHA